MTMSVLKRMALTFLAAVLALTWARSGRAQADCIGERGQDLLDVLSVGVRHNVWLVLDTSGSMGEPFQSGGASKLDTAKVVIGDLLNQLVDSSQQPLVNWGFVHFDRNPQNVPACSDPFEVQCQGLRSSSLINPPACGGPDNREQILDKLGLAQANGWTPNGKSLDQVSTEIQNNFLPGLLLNQQNFVIILTDGDDTCECSDNAWDEDLSGVETTLPVFLRSQSGSSSPTQDVTTPDDRRAYNAGLKGQLAYTRLNPSLSDRASAEKGDVFVVGLGLADASKARANHLAWEASGIAFRPDARPAFFADNAAQLNQALRDIFANIGLPAAEVTLSASVVGSVKEVVVSHTNTTQGLTNADLLASGSGKC